MLFLRKSASNFEYLRQNLTILSAPMGADLDIRYRTRWLQPSILQNMPKAGELACIHFADPPYEWHLPVRFATLKIDPYMTENGSYVFLLTLGDFVDIPSDGMSRGGGTDPDGDTWFVYRDEDHVVQPSTKPEAAAWRWVIQNIVGFMPERGSHEQPSRRLERYLSSFFFRPAGFRDDGAESFIDPRVTPLQIGRRYVQLIDCYAPHISPDRVSGWELVGQAEPAVADVWPVLATADGLMGMHIIPRLPGATTINVWVQPEQARSSQILVDCRVEGEASPLAETFLAAQTTRVHKDQSSEQQPNVLGGTAGLSDAQSKRLYVDLLESYERKGLVVTHQDRFDLATKLIPFAADPRFLLETEGICLFRQGMLDGAWARLSELGLERLREPEAVAGYFISGWKSGHIIDIHRFVQRSSKSGWSTEIMTQIREALPWDQVMDRPSLIENLCMVDVLNKDVLSSVLSQYQDGDFVRSQIQYAVKTLLMSREYAYRFLRSWLELNHQRTRPQAVASSAIDYGLSTGFLNVVEIMDTYGGRIVQEVGIDQIQKWREPIEINFAGADRLMLLEHLAHLAASLDSVQGGQVAGLLMLEVAQQYLSWREYTDGEDLVHAKYCLEEARGLLMAAPDMESQLVELEDLWDQRAERTKVIREYLTHLEKHRIDEIKTRVKGKRAVVLGGLKQEFDPKKLAKELGFKDCEHIEQWGHKSSLDTLTTRIRDGQVDYVFDRIGFGPHRNEVRNTCRSAQQDGVQVHYITLYRSMNKRVIVAALSQYFSENDS